MSASPHKPVCLVCQQESSRVPLISFRYHEQDYWICPQHLPLLIHQPERLAAVLPGADSLSAADHDDD